MLTETSIPGPLLNIWATSVPWSSAPPGHRLPLPPLCSVLCSVVSSLESPSLSKKPVPSRLTSPGHSHLIYPADYSSVNTIKLEELYFLERMNQKDSELGTSGWKCECHTENVRLGNPLNWDYVRTIYWRDRLIILSLIFSGLWNIYQPNQKDLEILSVDGAFDGDAISFSSFPSPLLPLIPSPHLLSLPGRMEGFSEDMSQVPENTTDASAAAESVLFPKVWRHLPCSFSVFKSRLMGYLVASHEVTTYLKVWT